MKIEHWRSQSRHPLEQLDYSNLLGACNGNERQPPESQHCDTRKGDRPLSRNPADKNHHVDKMVRFIGDGRIVSDDLDFNSELNEVLNLNFSRLIENRKAVLDGFLEGLCARSRTWPRSKPERVAAQNGTKPVAHWRTAALSARWSSTGSANASPELDHPHGFTISSFPAVPNPVTVRSYIPSANAGGAWNVPAFVARTR